MKKVIIIAIVASILIANISAGRFLEETETPQTIAESADQHDQENIKDEKA